MQLGKLYQLGRKIRYYQIHMHISVIYVWLNVAR